MRRGFGEEGILGIGVGEVYDMYGSSFGLVGRYENQDEGYGSREVCIGLCKAHGRGVQEALVLENWLGSTLKLFTHKKYSIPRAVHRERVAPD